MDPEDICISLLHKERDCYVAVPALIIIIMTIILWLCIAYVLVELSKSFSPT
jgi:hypothetical protein